MNLEVVLAQPQLPVGQNQVRGFPTDLANGEPAFGWKNNSSDGDMFRHVRQRNISYQLSFMDFLLDPWAEILRLLEKKKSRNSGWRGHSTAQESQVSWLEVNLFAGVMRWYTSRIHISWLQKWSLGMAFPSFLRPQNLEKLSLEELHQRKHDLKQEDQLRRARRFFSMRYKMYEATRCIYTVVCCNML